MRVRIAFDGEAAGAGHDRGQRLRAAHAAEPAGQDPVALEVAAIVLAAGLDEGLVGALHDALRADIDPRAGRHLAVHHQALLIELVEMVPGRPVRHEVGVGDQHARRIGVGAEHADRLAGLHQQRLVVARASSATRRCGRSRPSCARRGRCRHRRRARSGSRRRRDRGCSSACAAALRSARILALSSVPRGARISRMLWRGSCHVVILRDLRSVARRSQSRLAGCRRASRASARRSRHRRAPASCRSGRAFGSRI